LQLSGNTSRTGKIILKNAISIIFAGVFATDSPCSLVKDLRDALPLIDKGRETMTRKPLRSLFVASLLAISASAAFAQTIIVAPHAPPPPRVETVPPAREGYAWDPGHWRWDHGGYVWAPGHWQPIRVGHRWVPGHWVEHGPNWRWVEGHWA
jgi:hypothetical protein